MNNLKLNISHIKTCYMDDLQCHHYGDNTLVISADTVSNHDESLFEILDGLLADCNGYSVTELPFVGIELETALQMFLKDLDSSYYVTNIEFPECRVYILLDWNDEDIQ